MASPFSHIAVPALLYASFKSDTVNFKLFLLAVICSLLDAIAESYLIDLYDLTLTASIGIALYRVDGVDLETLSKNADAAMYRAKQEGRQCYRFFTQEMQARSARNLDTGTKAVVED
jgi:predicted signal transduction protein with EAL and GGDEF domain